MLTSLIGKVLEKRKRVRRGVQLEGYAYLVPAMALLALFHLLPVAYALFLSLFDARLFREMWRPGPFIATGNYARLLTSGEFGQSVANTLWYAGITVPLGVGLALIFAQLLHGRIWGRSGYRVVY